MTVVAHNQLYQSSNSFMNWFIQYADCIRWSDRSNAVELSNRALAGIQKTGPSVTSTQLHIQTKDIRVNRAREFGGFPQKRSLGTKANGYGPAKPCQSMSSFMGDILHRPPWLASLERWFCLHAMSPFMFWCPQHVDCFHTWMAKWNAFNLL
jgi:hypothetical protein